MDGNKSGGHRNVKQILTVEGPSGRVSQIYTVTQRAPSHTAQSFVSPIGKIQAGASYSLLRKDNPIALKSRTTPSILRKGPRRKFTLIRDPSKTQESVLKYTGGEKSKSQTVVATVKCASTSNQPFLTSLNGTNAHELKPVRHLAYRSYARMPPERKVPNRVKVEARIVEPPSSSSSSNKPIVKRILVRRTVPLFETALNRATREESLQDRLTSDSQMQVETAHSELMPDVPAACGLILDGPKQDRPIHTSFIKNEAPDEFVIDTSTPQSDPSEGATSENESSANNMDFVVNECDLSDQRGFTGTIDDYLEDISKNVSRNSENFYMISHESLLEVLSTCNICASAADVTLQRKGTTCEANIKCRKTAKHDAFWDGEQCRTLGLKRSSREERSSPNLQMLHPCHDVPWSLILMCLIAKIVDIPIKKLEHLCRVLFAADNIGSKLQAASSLATSFPMIHGLTKPRLEKPLDSLKMIVVCRRLLVFLDPFSYSPLACFEFPGTTLSSTSDLSSALNIGLQRLQLLNSNKFSSVDVVQPCAAGEDSTDWKPVLVPDMDLMYQEALTSLHVALWHNKFEFDIKSSRLRAVLEDISKALCFFQPEVARMSEREGRTHYSVVLKDLMSIHDRRYVPLISEITLLRSDLQSLTSAECKTQIETLIREVERIDVYNILNPLYENIISTADASYVVSIRREEPCRATHKVMKMIELCQDEELSSENALRALLLLPVRSSPIDVIENICGFH